MLVRMGQAWDRVRGWLRDALDVRDEPNPGQPQGRFWAWLPGLLGVVVAPLVRAWGWTLRIEVQGLEHVAEARRRGGLIFGLWHGNMLAPVYWIRDRRVIGLVSPHYIGELIARVVGRLGFDFIRASSGYDARKGVREMLKALGRGRAIAVMLDGPDGPARQINASVAPVASRSGAPVLLCHAEGRHVLRVPSWDGTEVFLPFSRVVIRFSEPLNVPRDLPRGGEVEWHERIRDTLLSMEREMRRELEAER